MNRLLASCISIAACCCTVLPAVAGGTPGGGGGGETLGRCCFLGIVPEPILCEVTTQAECFFNSAPISWTAGLTCDTPCESNGHIFAGCGTLGPGPQGCVLFHADTGETFALENTGNANSLRVYVRGIIDPQSTLCFPAVVPGLLDNTICACFESCGTLILGVECPLFAADAGGVYVIGNLGGFQVGDRVRVRGCRRTDCVSICQQGNGCIEDNTIESCNEGPSGACCVPLNTFGAHCVDTTEAQCAEMSGDYKGDGTTCADIGACPPLGRCCFFGIVFPPFLCDVTTEAECAGYPGGTWTLNLTCDAPCDGNLQGACCFFNTPGTMNCAVMTPAECHELGGQYQGHGTNCGPTGFCEPRTGACCLITPIPEGECVELTAAACAAQGGTYQGDGTHCPPNGSCMFDQGACCLDIDDGPLQYDTCILTSAAQCSLQGGVFQGENTVCQVAACCLPNGACQDADPRCCVASGGTPRNIPCSATACSNDPTGACCLITPIPEGVCIQTTAEACAAQGGNYHGDGTHCPPNGTCMFDQGACCVDVDDGPLQYDTCFITTALHCDGQGGVFQGPGTVCQSAACCLPGGYCQEADPRCCIASGGTPWNVPCGLAGCDNAATGACCLTGNAPGANNCIITSAAQCEEIGGEYRGDGTTCANACPPLGRCCFVGIVPEPILCDVTTRAECMAFAGFISWTAHLTCDAPCDGGGGGDVFAGCGTLGPGPQGCVLFHADSGQTFALENAGPVLGPRVFVRGVVEPQSFLCFPIVMPALLNNTISVCFEDCGVLIQGVECVLFQADNGGLYKVQNLAGFGVGDRVRVRGGLNPLCFTFCQQGDGCIDDNTIEPCDNTPPTGACCYAALGTVGNCIVTTPAQCAAFNGQYQGHGTTCQSNQECPAPLGRCCFLGFNPNTPLCEMMTESSCMSLPAPISWDAHLTCATPCNAVPRGACCNTTVVNALGCLVVSADRCQLLGGVYQGDGTTCFPVNPCAEQTGRCCFLGFNPQTPLCAETTLAQCYSFPAVISWTPGLTCDVPCEQPCEPGDANGDGKVDGRDVPGFVRSVLGSPASGDHPDCCNLGATDMHDELQSFIQLLTAD